MRKKFTEILANQITPSGKGWTVAKVIGTRRTGRVYVQTDIKDGLTMAQACVIAENLTRDANHPAENQHR